MIAYLTTRFGPVLGKVIFWASIVVLVLVVLATAKCVSDRGIKTQVKLEKNQTNAAIQSGKDAVDTLGNRQAAEDAAAQNVQETQHAIENASHVSDVTGAGLAGLRAARRKAGHSR